MMSENKVVHAMPLRLLMAEFKLALLTPAVDVESKELTSPYINRPALQLANFYSYFDYDRTQVIGMVEYTYLSELTEEIRREKLEKIFQHHIPALILCRGLAMFPEMMDYAKQYDVPIFSVDLDTSEFVSEAVRWMKVRLAPRIFVHGVLLDVYGVGLLIMGDSGVGKSETALELIKRGHRFIADDAVEIKRVSQETLLGSCPEKIRYFLELRGIGIIDIMKMFGVQSIKTTQCIDLVVKLQMWDSTCEYDRVGQADEYMDILGNKVMCCAIPIRPGRSVSVICESAAINHRQKKMGYNAADALCERIMGMKK